MRYAEGLFLTACLIAPLQPRVALGIMLAIVAEVAGELVKEHREFRRSRRTEP